MAASGPRTERAGSRRPHCELTLSRETGYWGRDRESSVGWKTRRKLESVTTKSRIVKELRNDISSCAFSATGSARQRPRTLSPSCRAYCDFRASVCHSAPMGTHDFASHSGQGPGAESHFLSGPCGECSHRSSIRFERSPRRICQRERRSWHEPSTEPDLFPVPHRFANDLTILQIDRPSWRLSR